LTAFDLVSASVPGPAPVGEPASVGESASKGGPQAEFHVTDRISLLKTLKNAQITDIPPTVWACLWLSDIDKLKELVDAAKRQPAVYYAYFNSIESEAKIVQKCEVYRLPCVLISNLAITDLRRGVLVDLLMLCREPTRAQAFYLLNSSATIYSTGATFPNSTTFLSATTTYSTGATFPNSTTSPSVTTISSTATLYFTE
jgi:hypothetical protein